MISHQKFSFKKRLKSFKYAFSGIRALVANEHNSWIHLTCAAGAVAAGVLLHISTLSWALVAICIGAVLSAEALNSAVEALCDKVSPEFDPLIGKAKDLAAAGVLFVACAAFVAGLLVFLPPLIALCR